MKDWMRFSVAYWHTWVGVHLMNFEIDLRIVGSAVQARTCLDQPHSTDHGTSFARIQES